MLYSAVILIYISWFSRGSGELRRAQVATSTTAPTSSATPENQQVCDYYCQYLNGPSSYCKYWQFPRVCQGGDQPCSVDDCDVPDGATIPPLPTPSAADAEIVSIDIEREVILVVFDSLGGACSHYLKPLLCS
ncbi:hypothetical protein FOZ60_006403 [Perkinsus olseni]|uniref:Uncharacterized protein n=1 Tax=Perkinsus olseni TaxID=32597 RepID=A0A7J6NPB8_PEROL|nr:hypothetical protein FOZ60_006403 [Perkinsus olseni]